MKFVCPFCNEARMDRLDQERCVECERLDAGLRTVTGWADEARERAAAADSPIMRLLHQRGPVGGQPGKPLKLPPVDRGIR